MPPLVVEASLALAIVVSAVKVTVSISRIEQSQKVSQAQVLGKIEVIHTDLESLKEANKDIKAELKENRRYRFSDRVE